MLQINQLDLQPTSSAKNNGAMRLLPNVVDFSNVDIRGEQLKGSWGHLEYLIRPDFIQVALKHGPSNESSGYDLNVSIGAPLAIDRFKRPWDTTWYTFEAESRIFLTEDDWQKTIAREPIAKKDFERLDFRIDQEPSSPKRAPIPVLGQMGRWDFFAVVATRDWKLPAGSYEIHVLADDGVRVLVDSETVIDGWRWGGNKLISNRVALTAGVHHVRVEYFQWTGTSRLKFSLRRLGDISAIPTRPNLIVKGDVWSGTRMSKAGVSDLDLTLRVTDVQPSTFGGVMSLGDGRSYAVTGTLNGKTLTFDTGKIDKLRLIHRGHVAGEQMSLTYSGTGTLNDKKDGTAVLTLQTNSLSP